MASAYGWRLANYKAVPDKMILIYDFNIDMNLILIL